jgi:tetratricopeptide (TPR) repeat protein
MNTLGAISPQEAAPRVRAACERALEIDPSNSLAHASLAVFARAYDLDWGSADRHLEFAIDAPAVPAFVHDLAALHFYCLGRFPEAIREMELCVEEDPLSGLYHTIFALILVSAGAIERAYSEVHRALEIDPNFWLAHGVFAWIHVADGRTQEAIQANGEAVRLAPWPVAMGARAGLLYETGDTQGAEEMIERLRQMPAHSVPLGMLFYHLVRKELSAAAECYEKLIEDRHPQVTLSIYDPWMAPLRASSHWLRLARLLNLSGSPASHIQ